MVPNSVPFKSFWMAGYECADHLNAFGHRVDLLAATRHIDKIDEDYGSLEAFGIRTVREGIRWSQVETTPYSYDFSEVSRILDAAKRHGIQVVWDICHFGYPCDLTPLHPLFAKRFAALCTAFIRFYRSVNDSETLIVTPINEVGFISWLGGDVRGTVPYTTNQGWDVKYHLMKAYIEGIQAMYAEDQNIIILPTEPLVNVTTESELSEHIEGAAAKHESQFQVLDILTGRCCPELGGKEEYLQIIGVNFYYNNQSVYETDQLLPWNDFPPHPKTRPLYCLLDEIYQRYKRPIAITETSHPLEDRPHWINKIYSDTQKAVENGIPIKGICLYPIIDRPDWDYPDVWHQSGLWDIDPTTGDRRLYAPYAEALSALVSRTGVYQ